MNKTKHPIARFADDVKILHAQPHRHWHYVYRKRRAHHLSDGVSTLQIVFAQLFTVFASVFAGLILDLKKEDIGLLVGAFVIMPGIIDLSASISGAMSAKINHHIDNTTAHPYSVAIHDVGFALFIGVFCGLIVGLFGGLMTELFFEGDTWRLMTLGVLSMTTISILGNPLIAVITLVIKRLKLNPDNIIGPVESSIIDVISIVIIATYARLLS